MLNNNNRNERMMWKGASGSGGGSGSKFFEHDTRGCSSGSDGNINDDMLTIYQQNNNHAKQMKKKFKLKKRKMKSIDRYKDDEDEDDFVDLNTDKCDNQQQIKSFITKQSTFQLNKINVPNNRNQKNQKTKFYRKKFKNKNNRYINPTIFHHTDVIGRQMNCCCHCACSSSSNTQTTLNNLHHHHHLQQQQQQHQHQTGILCSGSSSILSVDNGIRFGVHHQPLMSICGGSNSTSTNNIGSVGMMKELRSVVR